MRAGNTDPAARRSTPRHARPWRLRHRPPHRATGRRDPRSPVPARLPDAADRRAILMNAWRCLSADSSELAHAWAGSAPSASRSAARRRSAAMGAGADSATPAAAVDTAIPERRQAASTSRLAAAASVSSTTVRSATVACGRQTDLGSWRPTPGAGRGPRQREARRPRSCEHPGSDPIGPQQAAADERTTDDEQPSAHPSGE